MEIGGSSNISQEELDRSIEMLKKVDAYYNEKIVGQKRLKLSLITTFLSNSHILVESVPGLAKTTAAKMLSEAVSGSFSRIQCTPDLLPSDIIGTQIFNYSTNEFETKLGPVYANFVLLDELNRSSSKTQSAMLEAMQEYQTSIGGVLYKMPEVFIVIATQNPIEQEGTYLLSEAQLDRFLLKENISYPTSEEELEVLNRFEGEVFVKTPSVLEIKDLICLQETVKRVYIDDAIKKYIVDIIQATRNTEKVISQDLSKYVDLGSSPRGAIAFMQVSKAIALMNGRTHVTPDDVKLLRHSVLRHRIALNFAAIADDVSVETIIDAIIGAIKTP
ncbi:MAG: AAA family ATPase [Oscillospiraceae bacterium]|nr:AAA family ATPase [Oscillospiraceae bacterium]